MDILIGLCGALLAIALLGVGVFAGWKLKSYEVKHRQTVTAEALTAEQQRLVREEQEAWMALHNYNAADAYNLQRDPYAAKKE